MSALASPPLSEPLRGASIGQAISRFFRQYATFTGRASRSEYWWWQLTTTLVYVILGLLFFTLALSTGELTADGEVFYLGPAAGVGIAVLALWALATLVPQIAVTVRRLHDANFSGWFVLLRLIPSLGEIALFVLTVLPPNPEGARFDKR